MENIKKYIRENYYYCPITGNLWRTNKNYSKISGYFDHKYLRIYIFGKQYYVHRVVWFLYYGEFPENQIDHIDRNRSNNKIENLREVTNQQNMCNTIKRLNNTSGFKGVSFDKQHKKWSADIMFNYKHVFIGYYNTKEEASAAYQKKAAELFGEFNPFKE